MRNRERRGNAQKRGLNVGTQTVSMDSVEAQSSVPESDEGFSQGWRLTQPSLLQSTDSARIKSIVLQLCLKEVELKVIKWLRCTI